MLKLNKEIDQIKCNQIITSKILLKGLDFNQELSKFLSGIKLFTEEVLYKIIDKTESKIKLEIDYVDNKEIKPHELAYLIEKVTNYIYESVSKIRFINDKNFIITFPRYFLNKNIDDYLKAEYIKESISENNVLYTGLFNINEYATDYNLVKNDDLMKKYFNFNDKNEFTMVNNELYDYCAMGGSFDHMHLGHKMFLFKAALVTRKQLYIGITSKDMISKKTHLCLLQSYRFRKETVESFLQDIHYTQIGNLDDKVIINSIDSRDGGGSKNEKLEALILTKETEIGGNIVNEGRIKNGMKPLIFVFSDILNPKSNESNNDNFKDKLSSSEIRNQLYTSTNIEVIGKLYNLFTSVVKSINSNIDEEDIHYYFTIIRDMYCQTWRRYHNINHIFDFQEKFRYCLRNSEVSPLLDEVNAHLAIFYHDIIYTPSRNDNEERSNEKFLEFAEFIERNEHNNNKILNKEKVSTYILATKHHFSDSFKSDDFNLNLLMDIDVSSMASEDFKKNGENILFEFSHHMEFNELIKARVAFLNSTLTKTIFKTPVFSHLEAQAKENNKILIKDDEQMITK